MSTSTESTKTNETSLSADVLAYVRSQLGGRRGLIILAVIALGAGAVFNWSWLVAAGIAPVLLLLAPCALMCGLGLCMNKMAGGSCSSKENASPTAMSSDVVDSEVPPSLQAPAQKVFVAGDPTSVAAPVLRNANGKAPNSKTAKGNTNGKKQRRVDLAKAERRADDA